MRYSKKETELYLNEIWIAKEQYEAHLQREKAKTSKSEYMEEPTISNGGKIHLRDFYSIFLEVINFSSPLLSFSFHVFFFFLFYFLLGKVQDADPCFRVLVQFL